jgi:riboflavin biosynthesis pyrimidine reductase
VPQPPEPLAHNREAFSCAIARSEESRPLLLLPFAPGAPVAGPGHGVATFRVCTDEDLAAAPRALHPRVVLTERVSRPAPTPRHHAPVFVLTHHAREPIEMEGGTIFHFVTEGFDVACARARTTAGEDGIDIAGGASTVRQALAAGVIDELTLDVAPVLFGSGERLFDGVESFELEPVEVLHSPLATHIRYRRAG